jgi:hypothetical protein
MFPNFNRRYDCSLSTSFSSKIRGNCPCILFPHHLSVVFSVMLSFICLVPFCNSVLRLLAAWTVVDLMFFCYIHTICISAFQYCLHNIIIIIIIIISFMHGIQTYIPETNHVSRVHSVAAIPRVLLMVHIALSAILNSTVLLH